MAPPFAPACKQAVVRRGCGNKHQRCAEKLWSLLVQRFLRSTRFRQITIPRRCLSLLASCSLSKQKPNIQLYHAILEFHRNALVKGHNIVLQWVPGHCGITGNSCADNAVREAHKENAAFLIPFSRTDFITVTRTIGSDITSSLCMQTHIITRNT